MLSGKPSDFDFFIGGDNKMIYRNKKIRGILR
jgi:hypothetical protein